MTACPDILSQLDDRSSDLFYIIAVLILAGVGAIVEKIKRKMAEPKGRGPGRPAPPGRVSGETEEEAGVDRPFIFIGREEPAPPPPPRPARPAQPAAASPRRAAPARPVTVPRPTVQRPAAKSPPSRERSQRPAGQPSPPAATPSQQVGARRDVPYEVVPGEGVFEAEETHRVVADAPSRPASVRPSVPAADVLDLASFRKLSPNQLRRVIVLNEVLGLPVALRDLP